MTATLPELRPLHQEREHPTPCDAERVQKAEPLLDRLRTSPLFANYRQAFEEATDMPLWLEAPAYGTHGPPAGVIQCPSDRINQFCRRVFWTARPCQACVNTHRLLAADSSKKAITVECFAGLQVTAVPIRLGTQLLGYLRTGQVFVKKPAEEAFHRVAETLMEDDSVTPRDLAYVRQLFFSSAVVEGRRYASMVELLVFFAEQLAALAGRQMICPTEEWPDPVRKVAAYLQRRYDHEHSLDELAQVAGLSAHHLCQVFKEAVGMTMTEFLNRERIHQAKKRLLSRYARISEVALEVGFGSLSQFNRCFMRYAGESPTAYRQRMGAVKSA